LGYGSVYPNGRTSTSIGKKRLSMRFGMLSTALDERIFGEEEFSFFFVCFVW
jgi:hypothetical protein